MASNPKKSRQGANFCLGKNLRLDALNYILCFRGLQGVIEKFKKPEFTPRPAHPELPHPFHQSRAAQSVHPEQR